MPSAPLALASPSDQREALVGVAGSRVGEEFEREGLERVTDKDRGRLIPCLVNGGPPAPQVIVIHAGQVVMDEAIGMHAFDGGGGVKRLLRRHAKQPSRFQYKKAAQAFAAVAGVAHALRDGVITEAGRIGRSGKAPMEVCAAASAFWNMCLKDLRQAWSRWRCHWRRG
jgi:hypothetical protein